MRAAHRRGAVLLGCPDHANQAEAWGHGGRSIGGPVRVDADQAWLRVLEAPDGTVGGKLWRGTRQADNVLPSTVPRPRLLDAAEWTDGAHAFRAELTTHAASPTCSFTPDLTTPAALDDDWWSELRAALTAVAATPPPTDREGVITQAYVHRSIPRFLRAEDIDTTVRAWTLAHGDLHWANITAPELTILDWEGFGPAPYGFDAAHLHAYALPSPAIATRVRTVFADVLDTTEGWLAQLTVAAILLQAAPRDPVHARLAGPVRAHAGRLLATGP